jgi:hypothetical protein
VISDTGTQTVLGGAGIDGYSLTGSGVALDFSQLYGIEKLDLTGTGNNAVKLTLDMVLAQGSQSDWLQSLGWEGLGSSTGVQQLVVTGDAGDSVQLAGLTASGQSVAHDGRVYQVYQGENSAQAHVQLLVDQQLSVSATVL